MSRLFIITLIFTAAFLTKVGATKANHNISETTTATVTKLNELNKEIKKIDLAIRAINTFLVSLNSYLTAFNNIIKEYKIVEVLGVIYTIFAFLFSEENLLICLFTIIFFILMLEKDTKEEESPEKDE